MCFLDRGPSEEPPATTRPIGRPKREPLRIDQKGKGPWGKDLCHTGRQASGEGGIRTRGGGLSPLAALAKRCYRPLSHLSKCHLGNHLGQFHSPARFSFTTAF